MFKVNASSYVRVPFEMTSALADDSSVQLRIRYDDGFVASINGVEVAHSNAPGRAGNEDPLTWSSTATRQRRTVDALVQESFDITEFRDVLVVGQNVLAIHGLNRRLTDADFWVSPAIIGQTPIPTKDHVSLALSEIAASSADDFWVEIVNTGTEPVTFNQYVVTTGSTDQHRVPLPDDTVLTPC